MLEGIDSAYQTLIFPSCQHIAVAAAPLHGRVESPPRYHGHSRVTSSVGRGVGTGSILVLEGKNVVMKLVVAVAPATWARQSRWSNPHLRYHGHSRVTSSVGRGVGAGCFWVLEGTSVVMKVAAAVAPLPEHVEAVRRPLLSWVL